MSFLRDLFGGKESAVEPSSSACFLCGSSAGGRWLDEATTTALRQPDKLMEFYALWDLRRGNFGPTSKDELPRQEARLQKLRTSKQWYLCGSCWPDK